MTDGSSGGVGGHPYPDGWAVSGEVVIITAEAGLGHYGLTMTYWYWTKRQPWKNFRKYRWKLRILYER
jgi:hypothetical protein